MLHDELGAPWPEVRSEKLGAAAEFDAIHSVERAVEVGSVDRMMSAAELRPHLIDTVARGIARAAARGPPGAAGWRRFRWRGGGCRGGAR
jgi:hypothetical protein